jgi:hypothetical protein
MYIVGQGRRIENMINEFDYTEKAICKPDIFLILPLHLNTNAVFAISLTKELHKISQVM